MCQRRRLFSLYFSKKENFLSRLEPFLNNDDVLKRKLQLQEHSRLYEKQQKQNQTLQSRLLDDIPMCHRASAKSQFQTQCNNSTIQAIPEQSNVLYESIVSLVKTYQVSTRITYTHIHKPCLFVFSKFYFNCNLSLNFYQTRNKVIPRDLVMCLISHREMELLLEREI